MQKHQETQMNKPGRISENRVRQSIADFVASSPKRYHKAFIDLAWHLLAQGDTDFFESISNCPNINLPPVKFRYSERRD